MQKAVTLLGGSLAQQRSTEREGCNSFPDTATFTGTTGFSVRAAPEGHLVLVLPPGEVVTGAMAKAAAAAIARLAGARKVPLLLVLSGVEAVTRSARTIFSAAETLTAVAVLGVTPVDRVIANFRLGGMSEPCPTRYFSTEREALAWLKRKTKLA